MNTFCECFHFQYLNLGYCLGHENPLSEESLPCPFMYGSLTSIYTVTNIWVMTKI